MKKLLSVAVLLMVCIGVHAQNDVTKFLGIPVDGPKEEMIAKLKEKGFRNNPYDNTILSGVFNGRDVNIVVVTNNNKVCRIAIADEYPSNESDIKIRFNTLCRQFKNNSKYMPSENDYMIPEDENIRYEMNVRNKRYEASFHQTPELTDSLVIMNTLKSKLLLKYTQEELDDPNPTEELRADTIQCTMDYFFGTNKSVWFMISEQYGEYRIYLFYDNKYNQANGEDL